MERRVIVQTETPFTVVSVSYGPAKGPERQNVKRVHAVGEGTQDMIGGKKQDQDIDHEDKFTADGDDILVFPNEEAYEEYMKNRTITIVYPDGTKKQIKPDW